MWQVCQSATEGAIDVLYFEALQSGSTVPRLSIAHAQFKPHMGIELSSLRHHIHPPATFTSHPSTYPVLRILSVILLQGRAAVRSTGQTGALACFFNPAIAPWRMYRACLISQSTKVLATKGSCYLPTVFMLRRWEGRQETSGASIRTIKSSGPAIAGNASRLVRND